MADKLCPIFVAAESHRQLCRGEDCQLWWFCKGPDLDNPVDVPGAIPREGDCIFPGGTVDYKSGTIHFDPPFPRAIIGCKRNENGEMELDTDEMFPQSAKTEEEPPLARLVLTAEAVKQIYGAH